MFRPNIKEMAPRERRYPAYKAERQLIALMDTLRRAVGLPPEFFSKPYAAPNVERYAYLGRPVGDTGVSNDRGGYYGHNQGLVELYGLLNNYKTQVQEYRKARRKLLLGWMVSLRARSTAAAEKAFGVYRSSYTIGVELEMFNHRVEESIRHENTTWRVPRSVHVLNLHVSPAYVESVYNRLYVPLNAQGVEGNFGQDFVVLNAHKLYVDDTNATIYEAKIATVKNTGRQGKHQNHARVYEIENKHGFIIVAEDNLAWGWGASEKAAYAQMGRRLQKAFAEKLKKVGAAA